LGVSLYARDGRASAYGKYFDLKQTVECGRDSQRFGRFYDYGYRERGVLCGQRVRSGYRVYAYPRWYIWSEVNRPQYSHHNYNSVNVGVYYDTPSHPNRHIDNRYDNGVKYQGRPNNRTNYENTPHSPVRLHTDTPNRPSHTNTNNNRTPQNTTTHTNSTNSSHHNTDSNNNSHHHNTHNHNDDTDTPSRRHN
jgi:hypothetical protein